MRKEISPYCCHAVPPLQRATTLRQPKPRMSRVHDGNKMSSVLLPATNCSTEMPEGTFCFSLPLVRDDRMNDDMHRLSR